MTFLDVLRYDSNSGKFFWLISPKPGIKVNDEAGYLRPDGYVIITYKGKSIMAHRLAFLFTDGFLPEHEVDHINGDKSDNRRDNLRFVSRSCNALNRNKPKDNKSGYKGVCFDKRFGIFKAYVRRNGKLKHLGSYKTAIEAAIRRLCFEYFEADWDCDATWFSRFQTAFDDYLDFKVMPS